MGYAFYDFSVSPYSYDFVQFYVCALAAGYSDVVFVPGIRTYRNDAGEIVEFQKCPPEEQMYRLHNLLVPLCVNGVICLSRAAARPYWSKDRFPLDYTVERPTSHHVVWHPINEPFSPVPADPLLVSLARSMIGDKAVVITIRDTFINPSRNCNVPAWVEAADYIKDRGYTPVFIPDTAKPGAEFGGHKSLPQAAKQSSFRLAVYEAAMLNCGINTGPMSLCMFSKRPMLYFKPLNPHERVTCEDYWRKFVIDPGQQHPWFTPKQAIVWEPEDDAATITKYVGRWLDDHGKV